MSGDKKFELGDYVEVKDRIAKFYDLFGQGRLVTADVKLTREPDDVPRVIVTAHAYRTPDDPHPGVGTSWLELPGRTPYTKGSEVENAETSAWGRAIGSLGILIDGSIASSQEVQNKAGSDAGGPVAARTGLVGTDAHPVPQMTADGGLIGMGLTEGKYDFGLRQTPDGWRLPFRLKDGGKSFIVIAEDALAEVLAPLQVDVIGKRITVWGKWKDETIPAKGTKPKITYRVLVPDRIATADWTLPAPPFVSIADEPPLEEPPDDLQLVGENGTAA